MIVVFANNTTGSKSLLSDILKQVTKSLILRHFYKSYFFRQEVTFFNFFRQKYQDGHLFLEVSPSFNLDHHIIIQMIPNPHNNWYFFTQLLLTLCNFIVVFFIYKKFWFLVVDNGTFIFYSRTISLEIRTSIISFIYDIRWSN